MTSKTMWGGAVTWRSECRAVGSGAYLGHVLEKLITTPAFKIPIIEILSNTTDAQRTVAS
jgi:hypothetical protein